LHPYQCSQNARLFPDDLPPKMQFDNSYDINTLWMSSFYIIFCGQMQHPVCMRMCSSSTTVTSVHGINLMGISSASASAVVLESQGQCHWLLSATWLISNMWFSENCSTGAAWSCTSRCEAEVVVSAGWSSSTLCGKCPAVVQCNISRKVDWMSRVNCIASFDGFFPVETLEGARFCSPFQNHQRSHDKISSSFVNDGYQYVETYSRECHVAYCCLSWNG
jgi:hypothetical protein